MVGGTWAFGLDLWPCDCWAFFSNMAGTFLKERLAMWKRGKAAAKIFRKIFANYANSLSLINDIGYRVKKVCH